MALSDTYRAAVLASNPQAYWPLADNVGSLAAQELMMNLSGIVQGGVTFKRPDPWAEPYAAAFDGASGSVVDMRSRVTTLAPWSIECWYRTTAAGRAGIAEFNANQLDSTGGGASPFLYLIEGCLSTFSAGGTVNEISDPTPSNDGLWHHGVATYQGGNLTLYRDGAQVVASANAGPFAMTGYWHIGNSGSQGFFAGDVCHVAIYPIQLSASAVAVHFNAFGGTRPPDPEPPAPPPGRKAWLVLGTLTRPLDDIDSGWACTTLDLGSAEVREVTNNSPDQSGVDDRTQFLGSRVVTANFTAVPDGTVPLDEIVAGFAPFMDPSQRPELHYLIRETDQLERVLVLRASAWSAPMSQPISRDFQLSWVAPDPLIRSAIVKSASSWSGSGSGSGRLYPFVPPRTYPAGGGGSVSGVIETDGDVAVAPLLVLFGPITDPNILVHTAARRHTVGSSISTQGSASMPVTS